MSIIRYDFFDGIGDAREDAEGGFVSYDEHNKIVRAMQEQLDNAWKKHLRVAREKDCLVAELRAKGKAADVVNVSGV